MNPVPHSPPLRFGDPAAFAEAAARAIADALEAVLTRETVAVLAVPGGNTARQVLPVLARLPLDWSRITLTLADERWVPPSDADSNEGLVRALIPPMIEKRLTGLYRASLSLRDAPATLAQTVPKSHVVFLGVGLDGHIASIFPGDAANFATGRFAAVVRPDHPRLTMTPAALHEAELIIIGFAGTAKHEIYDHALEAGPTEQLPVRHVMEKAIIFLGP